MRGPAGHVEQQLTLYVDLDMTLVACHGLMEEQEEAQRDPDRARRMIKELTCEAGIKLRITPHVLRHSFATHMYTRGVPVAAIEAMLGHTCTDETSIYIHVPKANKQQALEKITIERR